MDTIDPKRRKTDGGSAIGAAPVADTVRRGIVLQEMASTVAAAEYLAARDVAPAVIRRVLDGRSMRAEDRIALAAARRALSTCT